MLDRILKNVLPYLVLAVVLIVYGVFVAPLLNLPPKDAKPTQPTLTQIEDHELSQGILHVFTTGKEMVLVYEGKEVQMVMGGGSGDKR